MRQRILFISGEYPPAIGGVGDYTHQLAHALHARGYNTHVLSSQPSDQASSTDEPRVWSLDHTPRHATGWGWAAWPAILEVIQACQPDLVHIQYQTGAYTMHPAINLTPWLIQRLRSRPAVAVTAHDLRLPYLLPKADRLRRWCTTRLFNDADALIVTNAEDEQRVKALAPPDRQLYSPRQPVRAPIHVVPIGSNIVPQPPAAYDRSAWRAEHGYTANDVVVAYFGLLNRSKGVLELLHALMLLPPQYRLLIIGGAAPQPDDQRYATEVHALIAAQQLADRVVITGPCAAATVSAHLLASDLAVLPFCDGASYRRGSLLAALAHGVPTITTVPAHPLIPSLQHGVHVYAVPDADPVQLCAAIQQVAQDRSLRAQLAQGGRERAAHFGWAAIAQQHEAVYRALLAR